MATGGAPFKHPLLTAKDGVSQRLLSYVSYHVIPNTRRNFAMSELGFDGVEVLNIEEDKKGNSVGISLEILQKWLNKTIQMNVHIFMIELAAWVRDGYLGNNVWSGLHLLVEPELLSGNPAVPPPPQAASDPEVTRQQQLKELRIEYIQKKLKASLRKRCRNKLSTDWLPSDKAHRFALRDNYVQLNQVKKVKKALRDTAEYIETIHDILKIEVKEGGVNIALRGRAGIGKSSSMAILASDWAEDEPVLTKVKSGEKTRLVQFGFVFLTSLGDVKDNSTLEQIIMNQNGLADVPESQIKSILEGEHGKVLLLLDGYDEYEKGTNNEIDRAIEEGVGECFLIVTSREGDYMSPETLAMIDGEIEITGFSEKNIDTCAEKFLDSSELAKDFVSKSLAAGIYGLLKIPIILLMTVVLYNESVEELPKSLTEIIRRTVFLMIERCTLKHFGGKKWSEIPGLEDWLKRLGELSLKALVNRSNKIKKEDVMAINPDLLKLGLLHGDFLDEASLEGRPVMMSYPHKLFLEFMGAYFALDYIKDDDDHVHDWPFSMLDRSMRMMVTFMYGLAVNKHDVLGKLGLTIPVRVNLIETTKSVRILLEGFLQEPSPGINPLYNMMICSMNDYLPQPEVHSSFYMFDESLPVELKGHPGKTSTIPMVPQVPCAVYIYYKTESGSHRLLQTFAETERTMKTIRLRQIEQTVSHEDKIQTFNPLNLKFDDDARLFLYECDMRSPVLQNLLQHSPSITNLALQYVRNVPEEVFSYIDKMKQLKEFHISGSHFDVNLSHALHTLLPKLRNLEYFGLIDEPTQSGDEPLGHGDNVSMMQSVLSVSSLKMLLLREITLSGAFAEVFKDMGSNLPNLNLLILNNVQPTQHGILALEKLVSKNKVPALNELYLQHNNFTNCKESLEKLLRTVDDKLPDCQVFVSPEKLPVNLDRNYRCLRIQSGPKNYEVPGGGHWQINP